MLEPILEVLEVLERGEPVNLLFATDADFSGLDQGALWQDGKTAGTIGLKHRSARRRFAIVTDGDWLRHAIGGFGWLSPGELRVFEPDELDQAKAWVAAEGQSLRPGTSPAAVWPSRHPRPGENDVVVGLTMMVP